MDHPEIERIIVGPLEIRPDRSLVLLGERTLPPGSSWWSAFTW